jgi:hypothetical protein
MAKRIFRPTLIPIVKKSNIQRAEDILKLIRDKQPYALSNKYAGPDGNPCVPVGRPWIFQEHPVEPPPASPSADDWQRFKRDFVEEYGHERVEATGMTHSDFFDYFKNGVRECEPPKKSRLKELLEQLDLKKKIKNSF